MGHLSLQTLGYVFAPVSRQASSNYGIDDEGRVGMYVEEKNRSWCSSSNANDQRAVTIEIASDKTHPQYAITDKAMEGLIKLCADICKRNGIPKLLWKADKSLIGQVDRQNITVHRWLAKDGRTCPGDYIYDRLGYVADEVNKILLPEPNIIIPKKPPYTVRILADTLQFRKSPGINSLVVGTVRRNEVYTIVEESFGTGASKWGRLKSGAGWIPIDSALVKVG